MLFDFYGGHMKIFGKRLAIFIIMLSVMILATLACMKKVKAGTNGNIGSITIDGNTKIYSSLESLTNDM